ncbi:MAG: hypothetical protein AB7G93_13330 [Bdellovibrionales bacterium]
MKTALGRFLKQDGFFLLVLIVLALLAASRAHAVDIPGSDFSGDLETLGSIAQTTDTIAFGWIRPFAAGVFLIIGCVGLVRSHFLLLVLGFGAALIILLTPKIVKEIGKKGGSSILSSIESEYRGPVHV